MAEVTAVLHDAHNKRFFNTTGITYENCGIVSYHLIGREASEEFFLSGGQKNTECRPVIDTYIWSCVAVVVDRWMTQLYTWRVQTCQKPPHTWMMHSLTVSPYQHVDEHLARNRLISIMSVYEDVWDSPKLRNSYSNLSNLLKFNLSTSLLNMILFCVF